MKIETASNKPGIIQHYHILGIFCISLSLFIGPINKAFLKFMNIFSLIFSLKVHFVIQINEFILVLIMTILLRKRFIQCHLENQRFFIVSYPFELSTKVHPKMKGYIRHKNP